MICPKCGSEMNYKSNDGKKIMCDNGSCMHTIKITYKQRLDKVLSKFEDTDSGCRIFNHNSFGSLSRIEYGKSTFNLLAYTNYWENILPNISLETVESLLKDLEAK